MFAKLQIILVMSPGPSPSSHLTWCWELAELQEPGVQGHCHLPAAVAPLVEGLLPASLTVQGGLQSGHRSLVSHMEHTGVLQGGALCSSQAAPHQGLRGPSRLVPLTLMLGPLCSGDGFFSSFT